MTRVKLASAGTLVAAVGEEINAVAAVPPVVADTITVAAVRPTIVKTGSLRGRGRTAVAVVVPDGNGQRVAPVQFNWHGR